MSVLPEVVILNDYASVTGGSTAVAIASALGLARQGVRVTFFTCVGPIDPSLRDVPNLEVLCLNQVEIAKDPNRARAFTGGLRNGTAVQAVRTLLSRKNPAQTIVHVHTWTKALSPFALAAVTDLNFPLIVTLHDFFITCPTGGFFNHRTNEICTRTPLSSGCVTCNCDRRNYGHKLWRVGRTLIQNSLLHLPSRTTHFVGVSHFSLAIMRPFLPPECSATVVRNPVDCLDLGPAPIAENRAFVFVGRFEQEKGVRLFAQAVQATGLPAVFIGDGALAAEIRQRCPQARFTGWLKPAQIRQELSNARALVFPPLWYETLGLVAVEATAAGVPPLISNRCAATDFIKDGETGLHFDHGSVDSLARQMRRLADEPDLAPRLGRNAYQWYWNDPWTAERHVADLLKLYQSLMPLSLDELHQSYESTARI